MNELELVKARANFVLDNTIRFNPNHDSKTGKFTGNGGSSGGGSGTITMNRKEKREFDEKERDVRDKARDMTDKEAFKSVKSFYDNYQDGTASKDTFFFDTMAEFNEVSERPSGEPDYTSASGSEYWYSETGVIRGSNHWGDQVASCSWALVGKDAEYYGNSFDSSSEQKYGKANWDSFTKYSKPIYIGEDTFVMTSFNNEKVRGELEYEGNTYLIIGDKGKKLNKSNNRNEKVNMNKGLEQRSYSFEIRAEQNDDQMGVITGRPIVYNSKTDLGYFDEIIERGALDGADLRDVRFLVNHDISKIPLARSRNNNANSTMQLMPNENGMDMRVNLDIKRNTEAMNLYSAVERGDISGMSFMFSIDDEEWEGLDTDHPTRHIRKISNVVEVSAVTFPAYSDTSIAVRNKEALESAKLALENAKRSQNQSLDNERRSEIELAKAKFEAIMKVR